MSRLDDEPTPPQTLYDWFDLMRLSDKSDRDDWIDFCARCLTEVLIREKLLKGKVNVVVE